MSIMDASWMRFGIFNVRTSINSFFDWVHGPENKFAMYRCLSRTNPMNILVRNQVYHHTPTRMICHYTNRDDLWKNYKPFCTRSERLFDTPLRRKLRTLTSLILLRWSMFECMYIIMYFCADVSCDLDII